MANSWDFFDVCYAVNLDSRKDRLAELETETARVGLKFVRWPGVVCGPKDLEGVPEDFCRDWPAQIPAMVGCGMSHIAAITRARDSGAESCLMLEDDVVFSPNIMNVLPKILAELASLEWDLFYFFRDHHARIESVSDHLVRLLNGTDQTHAYAIHRRFYDEFLNGYQLNGKPVCPIDVWYRLFPSPRKYVTKDNWAFQRASYSDIQGRKNTISLPPGA